MAALRQFEVVEDEEEAKPDRARAAANAAAVSGVALALHALSQRALAAISDLFMLVTIASAWWLWWSTPEPTQLQLIGLGMYGVFILAANVIARRRK